MPDPILTVRGCRWISITGVSDPRGRLNFIETGKGLDFLPKRIFWLRGCRRGTGAAGMGIAKRSW